MTQQLHGHGTFKNEGQMFKKNKQSIEKLKKRRAHANRYGDLQQDIRKQIIESWHQRQEIYLEMKDIQVLASKGCWWCKFLAKRKLKKVKPNDYKT